MNVVSKICGQGSDCINRLEILKTLRNLVGRLIDKVQVWQETLSDVASGLRRIIYSSIARHASTG